MTLEELLANIKDVDFKTEYQHVYDCPLEPIEYEYSERTFLRYLSCKSNAIGADDDRVLRTLCFNSVL